LRILEYYSGILFLTTNRVGAIDDAFRSRLHLILYYPKLDQKQTIKIWKTNLERIKSVNETRVKLGRPAVEFERRNILKWVEKHWKVLHWNGRQIRNAFQTAVAIGEFEARAPEHGSKSPPPPQPTVITVTHFKTIAKAAIEFNEYLLDTHGFDEERTAKRDGLRAGHNFDNSIDSNTKIKTIDLSDDSEDSESDSSASSNEDSDQVDGSDSDSSDSARDKRKKKSKRKSKDKKKGEDKKKKKK
jgi:hypothetical protein